MSYARSPRVVCSTTMGMSVVARGLESSACFIESREFAGRNWSGPLRLPSLYFRILLEPLKSLFAAELRTHPIQRPLLCQAGANRWRGLATTLGDSRNFPIDVFVARFDLLRRSDAIKQQLGFHILDSAGMLAPPHSHPIHVYGSGVPSLPCPP